MTAKTNVRVLRKDCRIGDNVFFLIGTAFKALERDGRHDLALEMQTEIDNTCESPSDVLKVVQKYVVIV